MIPILKLMRVQNLLFVMAFQILIRYAVIDVIVVSSGITLQFATWYFVLLLVSTFLILGAGYIINGYFDTRIDAINKPDQVIVGRAISRRMAISLHQIFSIIGALIGVYLGWRSGKYNVGLSFIFIVGLLWFYSSSYKRQFLVGNLMVALVAGMTLLFVVIFDSAAILKVYSSDALYLVNELWNYVLSYALLFALLTFILGIIKDQITEPGDRELECHTLPIVWGSRGGKIVVGILFLFFIAYVAHIYYHGIMYFDTRWIFLRFILSLVVLPAIVSFVMNIRSRVPKDYYWSYRAAQVTLAGVMLFTILNGYYISKL